MQASGPVRRWWCWCLLALVLSICPVVSAESQVVPSLRWGPVRQLALTSSTESGAAVSLRPVDTKLAVSLAVTDVLLVPVRAGQTLRVTGSEHQWGFGFGSAATPQAITWNPTRSASHVVHVPGWGAARFVAIRAMSAGRVRVELGLRVTDPLALVRRDDRVRRWLRSGQGDVLGELQGAERALLGALGVVRDRLRTSLQTHRGDLLSQANDALGEILLAEWLADQYAERPLVAPFFISTRFEPQTLPQRVIEAAEGAQWLEVAAGQSLQWAAGEADIVEFSISTDAAHAAAFAIEQGGQRFERQQRASTPEQVGVFGPPQITRWVLRSNDPVRLSVSSGTLRLSVRAFSAEEALADLRPRRSVRRLLDRAERRMTVSAPALQAALGLARRVAVAPSSSVGTDPHVDATLRAFGLPRRVAGLAPLDEFEAFWKQSRVLPESERRALLVWVLWKAQAAWPPQDSPEALSLRQSLLSEGGGINGMGEPSPTALQALLDSVFPPVGGGRSASAAALEARSLTSEHWPSLLESTWRRAAPWVTQVPTEGARSVLDWKEPEAPEPGSPCAVLGPDGVRWSVIGPTPVVFEVAPIWGTHQVVRFQPLPRASDGAAPHTAVKLPADSWVLVDDQRFSVLPLLGVGSGVGVAKGEHRVRIAEGDPVLAQLPRAGSAPCSQLRTAERWAELEAKVEFELPSGDVPTVASVAFEPRDGADKTTWPARAQVLAGSKHYDVMFFEPGATTEVPIAPGVDRLTLHVDRPARVRVRARQHRTLSKAQPSPGAQSAAPAQETGAVSAHDTSAAPDVFDRLRQLSRALPASNSEQTAALRAERARLLARLGYRRLAELDWQRRAAARGETISPEQLEALSKAPNGDSSAAVRNEIWLPQRPESVVALDRAAELTPLPDDVAREVLQQAYAEVRRGAHAEAQERLLAAGAEQLAGRAALALAYAFESNADPARAAAIYERVAQRTSSPSLNARTVIALTNTALSTGDRAMLTRAHWLARRAVEQGARPAPLLGPIAPYVEWDSPTLSALGFGAAKVAQRGEAEEVVTEVNEVRAALLDKPPLARWFSAEASLSLLEAPSELAVTSLCFDRGGASEACHFEAQIDGVLVRCAVDAGQKAPSNLASESAQPERCRFDLPRGARRLRWVTSATDPLGWLSIEAPDARGAWQVLPQTLNYTEATPSVPLQLDVAGPAVLRVIARGKPGTSGHVDVRVTDAGGKLVGEPLRLQLPTAVDPGAQRVDVPAELCRSVSGIVLIEKKGLHRVSIGSDSSEVLIRPELARVRTPEATALTVVPLAPSAQGGSGHEGDFAFDVPRVGPALAPGSVTISADLGFIDQVKTEESVHELRAEAGVTLRKALLEDQLWLRTELLGRVRQGPSSVALEAYLSWAARESSPGFFALVRATAQGQTGERVGTTRDPVTGVLVSSPRTGTALGYFATVGASHVFQLSERVALLPSVDLVLRGADESIRGMEGVDSQVYSHYAWMHPRSWDALLWLVYRLRYDSVLQTALQARLNPDLDAVDNLQATVVWKWLGGSGYWPWIGWQNTLTWYEHSALRDLAFLRFQTAPSATVWRWLDNGDRVRATFACGSQWDSPSTQMVQPALFASLGIGYDFSGEQGLRDFVPFERPFRRRLEEGSQRVDTRAAGSNPHWAWEPSP